MSRHPAPEQLLAWVHGQEDGLTDHIELCESCTAQLEALEKPTLQLAPAIESMLDVDDDFEPRMVRRVESDLERRAAVSAFGELFGLGVETTKLVMREEDDR